MTLGDFGLIYIYIYVSFVVVIVKKLASCFFCSPTETSQSKKTSSASASRNPQRVPDR